MKNESLNILESPTAIQGLSTVMAYQAIQPITLFNHGKAHNFHRGLHESGPQTILSITNMRMVGVELFLKALIIQLGYCEILGPGMNPDRIKDLESILQRNMTMTRVEAYQHIIEALLMSGGLAELTTLSQSKIPRSELKHGSGPLLIIFEACNKILSRNIMKMSRTPILLQISSQKSSSKKNLVRFEIVE